MGNRRIFGEMEKEREEGRVGKGITPYSSCLRIS
jgi:hypothetical protein